ncbi:MAG: hypothetical protein Q4F27_00210 [Desulfovibrionaceae bacterium]|nr:hypothetical protein [Desulfovibrionaceae bacterium]
MFKLFANLFKGAETEERERLRRVLEYAKEHNLQVKRQSVPAALEERGLNPDGIIFWVRPDLSDYDIVITDYGCGSAEVFIRDCQETVELAKEMESYDLKEVLAKPRKSGKDLKIWERRKRRRAQTTYTPQEQDAQRQLHSDPVTGCRFPAGSGVRAAQIPEENASAQAAAGRHQSDAGHGQAAGQVF